MVNKNLLKLLSSKHSSSNPIHLISLRIHYTQCDTKQEIPGNTNTHPHISSDTNVSPRTHTPSTTTSLASSWRARRKRRKRKVAAALQQHLTRNPRSDGCLYNAAPAPQPRSMLTIPNNIQQHPTTPRMQAASAPPQPNPTRRQNQVTSPNHPAAKMAANPPPPKQTRT